jgi:hypothetical protein
MYEREEGTEDLPLSARGSSFRIFGLRFTGYVDKMIFCGHSSGGGGGGGGAEDFGVGDSHFFLSGK